MSTLKKYLITGSNGLLGQKLVYALLKEKDVEIIAVSKGENRLIIKEGYHYEPLDISDAAAVEKIILTHRPDVVINTAAMTNVDACETQKAACWHANVTGVQHLVSALEKLTTHPAPFIIHLSTDFVFDGTAGPYKEEDIPNPLSYYALSKLESEKIIQRSHLRWAIARTIIVYGVVDNMSRSNIVLWAKEALSKGQKINVVDDQFRAPTLAEDLAEGCILIAKKEAEGIFHLAGKDIMSVLELVYRVAGFFKLDASLVTPVKSDSLNQAAKRPPRTGFLLEKAKKILGYSPHSFEEGLAILDAQLKKNV